jgi:Rod binding domain-containing protein
MPNQLTSLHANINTNYDAERTKQLSAALERAKSSRKSRSEFHSMLQEATDKNGSVDMKKLPAGERKLYNTCTEMESLLWKQVLTAMRKTTGKHKLIDGGQAEEIFTDFLYDEYSMNMAKNAGTGIARVMFEQLSGYR